MFKTKSRRIVLKSKEEIELMRQAGRIVARALEAIRKEAHPGVSTGTLNKIAEDVLKQYGATPVFKGYPNHQAGGPPFPAAITASVNEELVHGIPRYDKILREGDLLSVDCGAYYKGWVGDSAVTIPVGKVSEEARRLVEVTEQALYEGIAQVRLNNRTEDISAAIQAYVEQHGYHVVREYTGHGVGRNMHEDPQVPNFGQPGRGFLVRAKFIAVVVVGHIFIGREHLVSAQRALAHSFQLFPCLCRGTRRQQARDNAGDACGQYCSRCSPQELASL